MPYTECDRRPRSVPWRWVQWTALLGALVACGDGSAPSTEGALEQATFAPECGSLNQACLQFGLDAPIATGASVPMSINFQILGSSGPPIRLETVMPGVLEVNGSTVLANQEGSTAMLVFGPDNVILDFIHLWVADPDQLQLIRRGDEGQVVGTLQTEVQMLPGDELRVSVEPYGGAQPLLGLFEADWTIEGGAVMVVRDGIAGWYRIVAREAGTATLNASALGLEVPLTVEVLP
ncbi:MAG: hypothetical protein AAFS10_19820 [Myxococcota bacterium]